MCHFCVNEHTTGIAHPYVPRKRQKMKVVYANGKTLTTDRCTDVRVNLFGKQSRRCKMCCRKQESTNKTREEKANNCKRSALGCQVCKEAVCKKCWDEGYDMHMKPRCK